MLELSSSKLSPVRGGFGTTRKSPFELPQSVPDFTWFAFKNFRYKGVATQKLVAVFKEGGAFGKETGHPNC